LQGNLGWWINARCCLHSFIGKRIN